MEELAQPGMVTNGCGALLKVFCKEEHIRYYIKLLSDTRNNSLSGINLYKIGYMGAKPGVNLETKGTGSELIICSCKVIIESWENR